MSDLLLGIDIGTSACKAGIVDFAGREVAIAREPTPWRVVPTGAELSTDDFEPAIQRAVAAVLRQVPVGRVIGIGITSMAEAGVLVDGHGRQVAPIMAWYDTRGDAEAAELTERLPDFSRTTGLPPTRLCSLAKYAWLVGNEQTAHAGRRWFSLAEWLAWRLSGEPVAEASLASRTGWLDVATGEVWRDALDAVGAPGGLTPTLLPAGTVAGMVRPDRVAGDDLHRLAGAVVTVAGHDHIVSVVGAGMTDGRAVLDSCGTAEAFVLATGLPLDRDRVARAVARGVTVGVHVLPDRRAWLGALRSGAMLRRVLQLLGSSPESIRLAPVRSTTPDPVFFDGDDPAAVRVRDGADPGASWRAAVDHVTTLGFSVLDAVHATAGSDPRSIVGCGGWLRDPTARAAKQRAFGPRFAVSPVREAGTRGAALLSGSAAGIYPSIRDMPPPTQDAEARGRVEGPA